MRHAASNDRTGRWRRARRARASLLWALGLSALLHPGLGLFLATRRPAVLDPTYGPRLALLRKRMAVPGRPLSVVMLGSSRTALGFLPDAFEEPLAQALGRPVRAFNFGMFSAGPVTNLVELRRLLRDGVRPDLLLLEVLPGRLNARLSLAQHGEPAVPTERLAWDDLPLVAQYDPAERGHLLRDWWTAVASPWYAHRLRVVARALPVLVPPDFVHVNDLTNVDSAGVTVQNWAWVSASAQARLIAAVRRDCPIVSSDFHLGGESGAALEEILRLCRKESLPVALVLMPEGPLFRSWYEPKTWAGVRAFLQDLSRRYDAPLINAREWMAEDTFFDSHHLLPGGATTFSTRLARDGIVPLLAGGTRVSSKDQTAHAHD